VVLVVATVAARHEAEHLAGGDRVRVETRETGRWRQGAARGQRWWSVVNRRFVLVRADGTMPRAAREDSGLLFAMRAIWGQVSPATSGPRVYGVGTVWFEVEHA